MIPANRRARATIAFFIPRRLAMHRLMLEAVFTDLVSPSA